MDQRKEGSILWGRRERIGEGGWWPQEAFLSIKNGTVISNFAATKFDVAFRPFKGNQ